MSRRELRSMAASFPLKNRAPVSASVAEDMTADMMEEWMWTAPLVGGGVALGPGAMLGWASLSLRKNMPPARERARFR